MPLKQCNGLCKAGTCGLVWTFPTYMHRCFLFKIQLINIREEDDDGKKEKPTSPGKYTVPWGHIRVSHRQGHTHTHRKLRRGVPRNRRHQFWEFRNAVWITICFLVFFLLLKLEEWRNNTFDVTTITKTCFTDLQSTVEAVIFYNNIVVNCNFLNSFFLYLYSSETKTTTALKWKYLFTQQCLSVRP